jgi:GT2 family glycosyltransferase
MKIAAIVVTYNRLTLLQECVHSLRNQTRKPDEIIIINNGSTDNTLDWLNEQLDLTIITQVNTGSSGGQYSGIKAAYEKNYDWIWSMDDDTLPELTCLESFVTAIELLDKQYDNIGWVCSKVVWKDRSLAKMNGAHIYNWGEWLNQVETTFSVPAKSCSFVSVMFRSNAIKSVGYPFKEYFMWLDDTEYTRRFHENKFSNFLVLKSVAIHQTPENVDSSLRTLGSASRFKYYFGVRNTPSMLKSRSKGYFNYILRVCEFLLRSFKELYGGRKLGHAPWFLRTFIKGLYFNPKVEKPQ